MTELDLHAPGPVVVLVGGADGLDDDQLARLRPLFEEGLAPLADALGACVIDGGTDTGVMGLIGQARAKLGAGFPLIGCRPRERWPRPTARRWSRTIPRGAGPRVEVG